MATTLERADELKPAFEYEQVKPEIGTYLKEAAHYIHERSVIMYDIMLQIGGKLREVESFLKNDGVFMQWCESEFDWSYSTLRNWMNVAKNLPDIPNDLTMYLKARALYKLAGESTSPEAVVDALEMARDGKMVDYETAYILDVAPETIKQRFIDGELPKRETAHLTRTLKNKATPRVVHDYCIEQGVISGDVVNFLTILQKDYERTKRTSRPRTTWNDIREDGGNLQMLDGNVVHISEANKRDVERYVADRQVMHIRESDARQWDWQRMNASVQIVGGKVLIEINAPRGINLVTGQKMLVDIRFPKK